jgi:hypothetical protein
MNAEIAEVIRAYETGSGYASAPDDTVLSSYSEQKNLGIQWDSTISKVRSQLHIGKHLSHTFPILIGPKQF